MKIKSDEIRLLIAREGFTRKALADKAGIHFQTLNMALQRGTAHPDTVNKIADALGVDPMTLIVPDEDA